MDNDTSVSVGDLFAGYTATGEERRALAQFDLNAIPSGSTVNDVTLTFSAAQLMGGQIFNLHALSTGWVEGTNAGGGSQGGQGTAPTPAGSVSWDVPWSSAGGDFGGALASQAVSGLGDVVFSSVALNSTVQSWIDSPSGNFGLILVATNTASQNAVRFGSREEGTAPMLSVDYTVPEPETYALMAGAVVLLAVGLRRCGRS